MLRSLTLTFFLLQALSSIAQNDSTIAFVAYWSTGDTKSYQLTKEEKRYASGELIKDNTNSYSTKFTVIDSTDTSYTVQYEFENQALSNTPIPVDLKPVVSKYENLNIIYQTNELGEFIGINNWEEISEFMNELFAKIPQMLDSDTENITKALEPLVQVYSTKEGIETYVTKELPYFHWPFGVEYTITDTLVYEDYLPNMFGGDPIAGVGKVYFDSVNFETNYCKLINTLSLDPEETKNMITNILETMIARMEFKSEAEKEKQLKEFEHTFSNMSIDINDYNVFEYEYYPGWPKNIRIERVSDIQTPTGKMKRIDILRIEEIEQ